ncbi:MAG: hypothetical protein MdMp024_1643 [Bacteroidales bacterium]
MKTQFGMANKERIDVLLSDVEELKALITDSRKEDSGGVTLGKAFDVAHSVLKELHDLAEEQSAALRKEVEEYRKPLPIPEDFSPAQIVLDDALERKNLSEPEEFSPAQPVLDDASERKNLSEPEEFSPAQPVFNDASERKNLSEPEEFSSPSPVPSDAPEKKNLPDFTKAFSVNDRFYFLKELFGGDMEKMNRVVADLNAMQTFEEAAGYLHETMKWDKENATVTEFLKLLKKRFR